MRSSIGIGSQEDLILNADSCFHKYSNNDEKLHIKELTSFSLKGK